MAHQERFSATIFVDGQNISKQQILYETVHGFLPGGFIGVWLGGIIFVEVTRLVSKLSPAQSPIKYALWGLLLVQLAYCGVFGAFLMHTAVEVFGNYEALDKIPLILGVHAFLSRILITASQALMAVRIWFLTRRNFYLLATILLCSMYHLAVSFAVGKRCLTARYYHKLMEPKYLWQMMYSAAIICDSIITISLSITLNRQRPKTKKYSTFIRSIALLAIESAFLTTAIAIASLALLGRVALGLLYSFSYVSAQAYVLSILLSLHSWLQLKTEPQQQSHTRRTKPLPNSRSNRLVPDAEFGRSILEIGTADDGIPEQVHEEGDVMFLNDPQKRPTQIKVSCSPGSSTGTTDASSDSSTPERGLEKKMAL